jgi:Tfp pilus assembly protein PilV
MEMTRTKAKRSSASGFSLLELMIAAVVLTVGVLGSISLISVAIGTNGRDRQETNSTAIAQMVMEKVLSVPANTSPSLSITDCSGTAAQTISTTGSSGGSGATLLSSGDVDFSKTLGSTGAPADYYLLYTTCGTNNTSATYDVRWNIKLISAYAKLITVSVQKRGAGTDLKYYSHPVTIRSLTGQGS